MGVADTGEYHKCSADGTGSDIMYGMLNEEGTSNRRNYGWMFFYGMQRAVQILSWKLRPSVLRITPWLIMQKASMWLLAVRQ